MLNSYKIIILTAAGSLFFLGIQPSSAKYPEITDQTCDSCNPCAHGFTCYSFPDLGRRCAEAKNPCSYYNCPQDRECKLIRSMLAMRCPDGRYVGSVLQVTCSCISLECKRNDGGMVNYDLKTGTEHRESPPGPAKSLPPSRGAVPGHPELGKIIQGEPR